MASNMYGKFYSYHDNLRRQRQTKHDKWLKHKEGVDRVQGGGSYREKGGGAGGPGSPVEAPDPTALRVRQRPRSFHTRHTCHMSRPAVEYPNTAL